MKKLTTKSVCLFLGLALLNTVGAEERRMGGAPAGYASFNCERASALRKLAAQIPASQMNLKNPDFVDFRADMISFSREMVNESMKDKSAAEKMAFVRSIQACDAQYRKQNPKDQGVQPFCEGVVAGTALTDNRARLDDPTTAEFLAQKMAFKTIRRIQSQEACPEKNSPQALSVELAKLPVERAPEPVVILNGNTSGAPTTAAN